MLLIMNVFLILLVFDYFWLIFCSDFVNITSNITDEYSAEPNENNLELFPPRPIYTGQTRMPRTFFKKLYSGAAFLTGLKLGAILSKKGFELGHGKIASTHSFQVFGKSVNSAMSLSYGSPGSMLPVIDDAPQFEGSDLKKRTSLNKEEKECFQVTVIENPSNETVENLRESLLQLDDKKADDFDQNGEDTKLNENVVLLYQDSVMEKPEEEMKSEFIINHNKRVKEFNENIKKRRNSKF